MIDAAFIDACKNPNVDTSVIQAIIRVESGYNELAINVNGIGSFKPKNKQEAKNTAENYIAKGYSVDIGLTQFNSNNLQSPLFASYSIDDLLDSCKNIKAGSDIFYLAYESTAKGLSEEERLTQALSIYNTGNKEFGFKNGYVDKYASSDIVAVQYTNLLNDAKKSNTKISLSMSLYEIKNNRYIRKEDE